MLSYSRFVVSGTYSNYLKIHDRTSGRGVMLDSSYTSAQNNKSNWKGKHTFDSKSKVTEEVRLDSLDFKKKLLRAAWRPNENQLTNAVGNSLVFLRGRDRTPELVWAAIHLWRNGCVVLQRGSLTVCGRMRPSIVRSINKVTEILNGVAPVLSIQSVHVASSAVETLIMVDYWETFYQLLKMCSSAWLESWATLSREGMPCRFRFSDKAIGPAEMLTLRH